MSARRGRKRKSGPRHANGHLKPRPAREAADRGTLELQDRRAWLAQGGRPELTSYPLGVLLANGVVSEDQHKAGCEYAWLYRLAFGRVSVAAVSYEILTGGPDYPEDEDWMRGQAARLARFQTALGTFMTATGPKTWLGRQVKRAVDEIVVYGKAPRWMLPVAPLPADCREAELFLAGIRRLAEAAAGRQTVTPVTGAGREEHQV